MELDEGDLLDAEFSLSWGEYVVVIILDRGQVLLNEQVDVTLGVGLLQLNQDVRIDVHLFSFLDERDQNAIAVYGERTSVDELYLGPVQLQLMQC